MYYLSPEIVSKQNRPIISRDIEGCFQNIHWHQRVQTNRPESITTSCNTTRSSDFHAETSAGSAQSKPWSYFEGISANSIGLAFKIVETISLSKYRTLSTSIKCSLYDAVNIGYKSSKLTRLDTVGSPSTIS